MKVKDKRKSNLTTTGIAKILHILAPNFFVMWDKKIREEFEEYRYQGKKGIPDDVDIYTDFLIEMQKFAFENKLSSRAIEISDQLNKLLPNGLLDYELTVPKLIDEYNWIRIYKGLQLTIQWPP